MRNFDSLTHFIFSRGYAKHRKHCQEKESEYANLSLVSDVNKSICKRQNNSYWLSEIILERVCRLSEVPAATLK